jgi:hypothetical protein
MAHRHDEIPDCRGDLLSLKIDGVDTPSPRRGEFNGRHEVVTLAHGELYVRRVVAMNEVISLLFESSLRTDRIVDQAPSKVKGG